MKSLLKLAILLLLTSKLYSQTTNVFAQITDPAGQTWNNGTVQINFIPTPGVPGPFRWPGGTIPVKLETTMTGTGTFTIGVPDNSTITPAGTRWMFTLCSNTSAPCQTVTLAVTGVNADLSLPLSSQITAPRFQSGQFAFGYRDDEVVSPTVVGSMYYNVTFVQTRQWTGPPANTWIPLVGGNNLPAACSGTGNTLNCPTFASNTVNVTNPGIFSPSQMNEYITSMVNGCSTATEQALFGGNATNAISGCLLIPASATAANGNAIAGYLQNQKSEAIAPSTTPAAVSGNCRANAAGADCLGGTFNVRDTPGVTPTGIMIGVDTGVIVSDAGATHQSAIIGYAANAQFHGTGPYQTSNAFLASTDPNTGNQWSVAYRSTDAGASNFALMGAKTATGISDSQPLLGATRPTSTGPSETSGEFFFLHAAPSGPCPADVQIGINNAATTPTGNSLWGCAPGGNWTAFGSGGGSTFPSITDTGTGTVSIGTNGGTNGTLQAAQHLAPSAAYTCTNPAFAFTDSSVPGIYGLQKVNGGGGLTWCQSGYPYYYFHSGYFTLSGGIPLTWSSTTNNVFAARDTGLSRIGVGIVSVGNGSQGDTSGTLQAAGTKLAAGACPGTPSYSFIAAPNDGMYSQGIGTLAWCETGTAAMLLSLVDLRLPASNTLGWTSTTGAAAAKDTGLSRSSAGVVAIGNGTQGNTSGTLQATNFVAVGLTPSTNPLCADGPGGAFTNVGCSGGGGGGSLPTGLTFNPPVFTVSSSGAGNGVLALSGNTSGQATITAPAVGGTATNPFSFSNAVAVPAGNCPNAPAYSFTTAPNDGVYSLGVGSLGICDNGTPAILSQIAQTRVGATNIFGWTSGNASLALDTGLSRSSAGTVSVGNGTAGNAAGTLQANQVRVAAAANGGIVGTEGTCASLTPASGTDVLCPSSTSGPAGAHGWAVNNNNQGWFNLLSTNSSSTLIQSGVFACTPGAGVGGCAQATFSTFYSQIPVCASTGVGGTVNLSSVTTQGIAFRDETNTATQVEVICIGPP